MDMSHLLTVMLRVIALSMPVLGWLVSARSLLQSSLVAAAIAAVVSLLVSWRTLRAAERNRLHAQIDRLVELSIEYPVMENDAFCRAWTQEDCSGDAMRYDSYCCFVFNVLESLWRFHHGSEPSIQDMFDAKEMIERHRRWWLNYAGNRASYPPGFQKYVDVIARQKEETEDD